MRMRLRLAVRQLLKTPGFTITALATPAICLGANLTIFSVVDAIVLRSLPLPAADRLVLLSNSYPGAGADRAGTSIANYFDRRGAIAPNALLVQCQPATGAQGRLVARGLGVMLLAVAVAADVDDVAVVVPTERVRSACRDADRSTHPPH
jgi:hypothetical protein